MPDGVLGIQEQRNEKMKKVMFGLVAAAAMVACADIESSNIVGYASAAMTDGCKMLTSQFVTIGSTGTDIQTIKGDGDDLSGSCWNG